MLVAFELLVGKWSKETARALLDRPEKFEGSRLKSSCLACLGLLPKRHTGRYRWYDG
mgnify:CR=1 FL=1